MHGDHVRVTRDHWTENAESYAAVAPGNWQSEPSWGSRVPEATGGSFPALSAAAAVNGRPPPYGSPGPRRPLTPPLRFTPIYPPLAWFNWRETEAGYSRKLVNCRATPKSPSFSLAMTAWRSSRFLPLTRS
jgi:hypothetical protein